MKKNYLQKFFQFGIFYCLLGIPVLLAGQQRLIKGNVISESGGPLAGVTVLVRNTKVGTTTDVKGDFQINVPSGRDTLEFRYLGYTPLEVGINGHQSISVQLSPQEGKLNEVVVIGYGKESRATLTTAVSKLDSNVLKNIPYANATSALEGTIPGLRVLTSSGQPGAAPNVVLRGGTSITNPAGATPLYVIDGVIREDMNGVNPSDIASIQVLKDAASTAIYGARGSNGVVIVTTKTGQAGRIRVSYNYSLTISQLQKKYPMGSARDYIYFARQGVVNSALATGNNTLLSKLTHAAGYGTGNDLTNNTAFTTMYLTPENEYKLQEGWQSMPDPLDSSKTIIFKGTDWQDVLFRTAISNNHYLSFSGGSDKATFDAGVGWLDDQGIAITTGYKRFTGHLYGQLQVRNNLKLFARVSYANTNDHEVYNINQIFERSLGLPPTAKLRYEDGTLAPGFNRSLGNPLYHLNRLKSQNNSSILTLSMGGDWTILPGLDFQPTASLYAVQGITNSFQMSYYNTSTQFIDSRNASAGSSIYWQKQFDGVFTYQKTYNNSHHVEVKAGASFYDRKLYSLAAAGRGAATDLIPTLNASAEPTSVSSSTSQQRLIGYFGRITYNYKYKYLFSANARYDGASNLGNDHKFGFFPGVSVGWNLHREPFWVNVPHQITSLKLRASYGVNGNISNLGDYQAQGAYSAGDQYDGEAAIQNTTLANQNLQWERSRTFDAGADIGLFDGRVSILFDYYRRVTDHLITTLTLPYSTGFSGILTNLGSLGNHGTEIELDAAIIKNNNGFNWNVSFNAARNWNKILKLPDNGVENNRIGGIYVYDRKSRQYTWVGGYQEGHTIGDLYSYKQVSIYPTDKDAENAPVDMLIPGTNKTKFGGDVNWLDADGNDTIDTRDQVYMGNIYPKWTGGFVNTFSYRALSLTIRTDFGIGHTIYNAARVRYDGHLNDDINVYAPDILHSWQKQGDVTNIPRFYWADQSAHNNIYRGNSIFYERGDYLCIREITISYSLGTSPLFKKIGFSSFRIYATGNNLTYFTNYSGLSPESGGTDDGRYPNPRNYILGVNISF